MELIVGAILLPGALVMAGVCRWRLYYLARDDKAKWRLWNPSRYFLRHKNYSDPDNFKPEAARIIRIYIWFVRLSGIFLGVACLNALLRAFL